jgi:hypothetical protein
MAGKLITLPLRVSLRSAQLLTRAAGGVAGRTFSITALAIQIASPGRSGGPARDAAPRPAPASRAPSRHEQPPEEAVSPVGVEHPPAPRAGAAEPPATPTFPPAVSPDELLDEPAHVSEEPELVAESAEPGAEEGAGADITVIEPWAGYGRLKAKDVIDRARTASVAELAAMRLYEARHRARQTVLAAVDRQLTLANGGRPA